MGEQVREWRPGRPCPVRSILVPLRRGAGDPTFRIDAVGTVWRASRTPEGPGLLRIEAVAGEGVVRGAAWGPGAHWLLDGLPTLLGEEDDWSAFVPGHPVLEQARRLHPHWRLARTRLVFESLLPAIIEQKVTGQEAFAGYRRLVRRYGEAAPGPGAELGLWVPPAPSTVAAVPSWDWIRFPVDHARSRAAVVAARLAPSLERAGGRGPEELDRALQSLPGIGVWTSAETRGRALGDPDAVSIGDYHVAKDIGWALTGTPMSDEEMVALLEPWRGHRRRVQALVGLLGLHRPRRGARMAPRRHLPRR